MGCTLAFFQAIGSFPFPKKWQSYLYLLVKSGGCVAVMSFRFHGTYPFIFVPVYRTKKERALKCESFKYLVLCCIIYGTQILIKFLNLCGIPHLNVEPHLVSPLLKFVFLLQISMYSCNFYLLVNAVYKISTDQRDAKYLKDLDIVSVLVS